LSLGPTSTDQDPTALWAWVGESVRPWLGWVVGVLGGLLLLLGYLGVSRELLVAKQLPFLVSGGLTGVALVFIGGVLLGTQDVRRQGQRIEALERMVGDLHAILLTEVADHDGAATDSAA